MSGYREYTYERDGKGRRAKIYAFFAVLSYVLIALLHQAFSWIGLNELSKGTAIDLAFYVGSLGWAGLFLLLTSSFDKHLWKLPVTRRIAALLGETIPPDLSGNYLGILSFNVGGVEQKGKVKVGIVQTWQRMAYTLNVLDPKMGAGGESHGRLFHIEGPLADDTVRLVHTYRYRQMRPNPYGSGQTQITIEGTSALRFRPSKNGWIIDGNYYSSEGATGTIELQAAP
jgi:hypothetical protein